jgi:hypothetical protein
MIGAHRRYLFSFATVFVGYWMLEFVFQWVHRISLSGVPDAGPVSLIVYPVFAISYGSICVWNHITFLMLFIYSVATPVLLGSLAFLWGRRYWHSVLAVSVAAFLILLVTLLYPLPGNKYVEPGGAPTIAFVFVTLLFIGTNIPWGVIRLSARSKGHT